MIIHDKTELFEHGRGVVTHFFESNDIPLPTIIRMDDMARPTYPVREGIKGCGIYFRLSREMHVCLPRVAKPVLKPGRQAWSYPGYKVDRTAIGVLAHEGGHHVANVKFGHEYHGCPDAWIAIHGGRKRVSSYEPNPGESFAESMRLFILNPELLREGIPERYEFIADTLGLKPTELRPWQEVLNHHPDYLRAALNWIAK